MSLNSFETVISKLAEKSFDVPFEHSTLTRILQPVLSGNANLAFLCTISPCLTEDATKVLNFACSAKKILSNPVSSVIPDDQSLFRAYKKQIEDLRWV